MRVLLDTNVWSYMSDDGSGDEWNDIAVASQVDIVLAPSVLIEAIKLPHSDVRARVIETMARGPQRRRLPPEAYLESMEFVDAVKRLRPSWVRQIADASLVAKFLTFWMKGVWREALEDSARLHELQVGEGPRGVSEELTARQREDRRELLRNNVALSPIAGLKYSAPQGTPQEVLRGWSGDPVDAWRIALRDLFWHQLVVVGGRAVLTREDKTYLDWIGAYLDQTKMREDPRDFTALWLDALTLEDVRRSWLRWAVGVVQLTSKVTGGNPVDEQHSSYLLDCDVFVTADRGFAHVLQRVREEAPFRVSEIKQIRAVSELNTARRLAEVLDL